MALALQNTSIVYLTLACALLKPAFFFRPKLLLIGVYEYFVFSVSSRGHTAIELGV